MSRRRFRIGIHPEYDRKFDGRKRQSQVLNPTSSNQISWSVFQMGDEHGIKGLLAECRAKLVQAENAVAEADADFEWMKAERANTGRTVPATRDPKAEAEYMDALAACDVGAEEVDKLEILLEKFQDKRRAIADSLVLRNGPVGSGRIRDGVLVEMDGQKVVVNDDRHLVIHDERSPYNGMLVDDYRRHVVIPWLATHKRTEAAERATLPSWPECVARPAAI
jgi:hypothetical protein